MAIFKPIVTKMLFLPKTQRWIILVEHKYHSLAETETFSNTEGQTKPRKLDFICKIYVGQPHYIHYTKISGIWFLIIL